MLVRPLSTVDNTRDYARVSHSRQLSNYNVNLSHRLKCVAAKFECSTVLSLVPYSNISQNNL